MKRIIFIMLILLSILSCKEKSIVDEDYVDIMYIKNSLSYTLKYELVGSTVEKGEKINYLKTGEVAKYTTEKVFEMHTFGDIVIDTLKFYNQSSIITKVTYPTPYSKYCQIEKVNDYTNKSILDVNEEFLNSH